MSSDLAKQFCTAQLMEKEEKVDRKKRWEEDVVKSSVLPQRPWKVMG